MPPSNSAQTRLSCGQPSNQRIVFCRTLSCQHLSAIRVDKRSSQPKIDSVRESGSRNFSILVRSGSLAVVVPIMVKLLPLPRVISMLEPAGRVRESSYNADELARIADAVARRGPRLGVGQCLVRSLVLYNLLRRFAYDAVFLIGGRLSDGRFDCHSWIEIDGKSLYECHNPREFFRVFYTFQV